MGVDDPDGGVAELEPYCNCTFVPHHAFEASGNIAMTDF
jgi:hypothetical protein